MEVVCRESVGHEMLHGLRRKAKHDLSHHVEGVASLIGCDGGPEESRFFAQQSLKVRQFAQDAKDIDLVLSRHICVGVGSHKL